MAPERPAPGRRARARLSRVAGSLCAGQRAPGFIPAPPCHDLPQMSPEQELEHFNTFGFVVKRDMFTVEEMRAFRAEYDRGMAENVATVRDDDRTERLVLEPGLQLGPRFQRFLTTGA